MYNRSNWKQKLSPALLQMALNEQPDNMCRVIIETDARGMESITYLVNASQGQVRCHMKHITAVAAEIPYATLAELASSRKVKRIWHDAKVRAMLDIAVPTVGGSYAQENGWTGKDTVAAVIDTGIYPHPDLTTPENRIVGWVDLINQKESPYDDNGHGTHIAGIIAGNGRSSRGKYKGMAPEAKLVGVKVLDDTGSGNLSDVITGIEWVMDNRSAYNIQAINLSLGAAAQNPSRQDPLCRATSNAWRSGLVVCTAAGNDGPDPRTINTPGINSTIITVGNLDDRRSQGIDGAQVNDSSSRGPTIDNQNKPDVLAPGTSINSLRVRGGYRRLTGTSMATGVATGAVLQVYQKWPSLKPNQVKEKLMADASSMDLDSDTQGAGVLNMEKVFQEPEKTNAYRKEVMKMGIGSSGFFGDNWWIIILIIFFFCICGGFN